LRQEAAEMPGEIHADGVIRNERPRLTDEW